LWDLPEIAPEVQRWPHLAVLDGHRAPPSRVEVISDGRIVTWSEDSIRTWSAATGAPAAAVTDDASIPALAAALGFSSDETLQLELARWIVRRCCAPEPLEDIRRKPSGRYVAYVSRGDIEREVGLEDGAQRRRRRRRRS
jgi:hypothetical protein